MTDEKNREGQIPDEKLDDASGGGSGRRTFEPILLRKRIDKSSPIIATEDPGDEFTQG